MKIYFVRHGQTNANVQRRYQDTDSPLNSVGQAQAEAVAKRFVNIPIDLILTSTYPRTVSTAQQIQVTTNAPIIESELLIERKMPDELLGKLIVSDESIKILTTIREHFDDPEWHYANEENFYDLIDRGKRALELITSQEKESVAVVSHGYFLQVLIYSIIFGDDPGPHAFRNFKNTIEYSNTGLTMCEYKNEKWRILTLNDYAHLGE